MGNIYGVLGMPVGDLASKQAIKAAGCTHTVVQAWWATLQPNGPGTALDADAVASVISDFEQAAEVGLQVMFELALQYPPSWVLSGDNAVEQFTDQYGNVYDGASEEPGGGQQVANWMWTVLGRQYVSDLCTKLGAALGQRLVAQTNAIKIGGGYYGELHYAPSAATAPEYSFWGYGNSMQTGTGLAEGLSVCPNPGYIIFSGTDAEDSQWLNWYLNGLSNWLLFFVGAMRSAGWWCDFHVALPGYGVRATEAHSTTGYQQSAGLGEDPTRMIGAFSHDSKIWPYCTWIDTSDGYDPPVQDSDISAWKKIYNEARLRNKHFRLWGENTGGENAAGLNDIFSGNEYGSALENSTNWTLCVGAPGGFNGLLWLDYSSLTSGNANDAQLSDLAAAIASAAS